MTRIVDVRALADPGASASAREAAQAAIEEAAAILRAGGLVAVPTETVYGLAARALDPAALAAIFAAKGRPTSHPLIAHVLDLDGARVVADVERARPLAARFWPGPLTFVLPRVAGTPAALSGGLCTVAIRAPAHAAARALIAALGEPIAAPSANRYQGVSPTEAAHVARALGDRVGLILDGGPTARGIESTVIDLTGVPTLLRPGPIDAASLRALLPELVDRTGSIVGADEARSSPGLDARHYAPGVPAYLFASSAPIAAGDGVILCGAALREGIASVTDAILVLPADAAGYATQLYAALHALEARGVRAIWIEAPPTDAAWDAIRDRLSRATVALVDRRPGL